jgi:hypothetical protein
MTAQEQSETFNTARSRRPTGWVECSRRGPAQVVPRHPGRAGGQTTSPKLVELAELSPRRPHEQLLRRHQAMTGGDRSFSRGWPTAVNIGIGTK